MEEQAAARNRAALGASLAGVAVALGAFGTHTLRDRLIPRDLEVWTTGVQYQALHGIGILVLTTAGSLLARPMRGQTSLMAFGTLVFSGSLYALALGAPRWLGAVAPIGGASLIAAWIWAALALSRRST